MSDFVGFAQPTEEKKPVDDEDEGGDDNVNPEVRLSALLH